MISPRVAGAECPRDTGLGHRTSSAVASHPTCLKIRRVLRFVLVAARSRRGLRGPGGGWPRWILGSSPGDAAGRRSAFANQSARARIKSSTIKASTASQRTRNARFAFPSTRGPDPRASKHQQGDDAHHSHAQPAANVLAREVDGVRRGELDLTRSPLVPLPQPKEKGYQAQADRQGKARRREVAGCRRSRSTPLRGRFSKRRARVSCCSIWSERRAISMMAARSSPGRTRSRGNVRDITNIGAPRTCRIEMLP